MRGPPGRRRHQLDDWPKRCIHSRAATPALRSTRYRHFFLPMQEESKSRYIFLGCAANGPGFREPHAVFSASRRAATVSHICLSARWRIGDDDGVEAAGLPSRECARRRASIHDGEGHQRQEGEHVLSLHGTAYFISSSPAAAASNGAQRRPAMI